MSPRSRSRSRSVRSRSISPVRTNGRRRHDSPAGSGRSRSRSPIRVRATKHDIRYSRSSSGSRSSRHSLRRLSRSRSPYDRYRISREKPKPSKCIGVFGLSVYTTQQKIREIFSKFGTIDRIQVVIDAQTRRSRGFCFIYYEKLSDAKDAKEACSGLEVDERRIRVDYSITKRPHAPTPGIYMGKVKRSCAHSRDHECCDRCHYRTSRPPYPPSPFYHRSSEYYRTDYRRRFERSRSPSYSPRRWQY